MDSKLSNGLKYKVTELAPAIFADNMMMLIMDRYDISWKPTFTTEEIHDTFILTIGIDLVLEIEDIVQPWYAAERDFSYMWHFNEESLSKFLYLLKTKFCRKSNKEAKNDFLIYCGAMIYGSLDCYKKGLKSALTIVFLEVYWLACYYSKRMNYNCDLIFASTES